jgi:hypothetical protein
MSSWKDKLTQKTTSAVTHAEEFPEQPRPAATGGWKQKMTDKSAPISHTKPPAIPKVNVEDLNDFPALGASSPAQPAKPPSKLTGFANLAREWSSHAKEEHDRQEKERIYREEQENAYNYNISKLNAVNNRLLQFNYNQVRYNDEYNADYNKDLDTHKDQH